MYERFTDQARKAMHVAEKVARKRKHEYVGTEHILLGILATEGVGYNMLSNWLKADLKQLIEDVDAVLTDGTATVPVEGKLPITPSAKQVLERAIYEARRLQIDYVGTEHLLIALTLDSASIAGRTLLLQGVTPEKAREACAGLTGLNFGRPAGEIPEKPEEKMWEIEIPQLAPSAVENVITMSLENTQQRDRSGSIDDPRPLVSFLYELMRDHLPTGVVEHITRQSTGVSSAKFCNGWLALYAQDVANRLLAGPPPVTPEPKPEIKDPPPPPNLVPVIMDMKMAHALKPGDKVTDGLAAYWLTRVGEVVQREAFAVDVQWPNATKPTRYDVDEVAAYQILRLLVEQPKAQSSDNAGNS